MYVESLSPRHEQVLGAVVEEFVQSAEPVGSRYITRKCQLGVSPATVRNAMSDLEEMGLLSQPHTSAGRCPTDHGYRYYVDHLMPQQALSAADRRRLRHQLAAVEIGDLEDFLDSACRALSAVCQQVSVVAPPSFESRVFRHIDFVLIRPGRVLVILVSASGVVDHRAVNAPEVHSQEDLDRMAVYLDRLLEGIPLRAVKKTILAEMAGEKALYDDLLARALDLGNRALADSPPEGDIYMGDRVRLLEQPEFTNLGQMRSIFEAFEKKSVILTLLQRASQAEPRPVLIGRENCTPDLSGCSVISRKYGKDGCAVGTVGVIGPTRMDYPRIIGLVDYTAQLIDEFLQQNL